jgi:hypothetical protein
MEEPWRGNVKITQAIWLSAAKLSRNTFGSAMWAGFASSQRWEDDVQADMFRSKRETVTPSEREQAKYILQSSNHHKQNDLLAEAYTGGR